MQRSSMKPQRVSSKSSPTRTTLDSSLLPTLLVVTILSMLAGFTVFDLLWVMGASYPGQRTLSLAVFMYFEAFQKGSWAFGSAIAVIIGIVVLSVTWIQAVLQHRVDRMTK